MKSCWKQLKGEFTIMAKNKRYSVKVNKYSHEGSAFSRTASEYDDPDEAIAESNRLMAMGIYRFSFVVDNKSLETIHWSTRKDKDNE